MFFTYLTRCFWISIALSAMSLMNSEYYGITLGLITLSFAILLHGAMKDL